MFIYPYKAGSNSARNLADGLGAKIIRLENSRFTGSPNKVVINWGNSTYNNEVGGCVVVNSPEKVAIASNKKTFFETVFGHLSIPDFTTDKEAAHKWIIGNNKVVVREKLTGNSGEGIVLIETIQDWDNYDHTRAKLYVIYIPKKQEYRVHVIGKEVALTQRKAVSRNHIGEVNYQIRNHDNGFVFVKNEEDPIPDSVIEQAKLAVELIGLDFGAVDVIYNEYRAQAFVLEVNTAPGMEGTTTDTYVENLKSYINMLGVEENRAYIPHDPRMHWGEGGFRRGDLPQYDEEDNEEGF